MRLTLDIGNSRSKSALFGATGDLLEVTEWPTDAWLRLTEYATNRKVQFLIYSTVANEPPTGWAQELDARKVRVEALSTASPLPFTSRYRSMNTLGRDRMAALAGAVELLPGVNCLIADAGTCLTLDLLLQNEVSEAEFAGGNISPGLQMRLRAMHEGTQRLPEVSPALLKSSLGLDTETALRHGGQAGIVYEIEGLYTRLRAKFPDLRLLLTGGDASIIQTHLKPASLLQPHLVHYGLYQITRLYAA